MLQALQRKEAALQQQLAQLQKTLQDKAQELQQQSHAHGLQKQVGCWLLQECVCSFNTNTQMPCTLQ